MSEKEDKLVVGTGLAHELARAFNRCGWSASEIKELTKKERLKKVRTLPGLLRAPVIHLARNQYISRVITSVHFHIPGNPFTWDPTKIELKLFGNQCNPGGSIYGQEIWRQLERTPFFNANLLDYLIGNPYLIPEEWKVTSSGEIQYIFFWGTIFTDDNGGLCVACLYWNGYYWDKGYKLILSDWLPTDVSAVRIV